MSSIAPTAATPIPPRPVPGPDGLPGPLPGGTPPTQDGGGGGSVRHRISSWMEEKFGKAAMPIAALGGGAVGAGAGMLVAGIPGAAIGGAAGAFFGALLFLAD